MSKIIFVNNIDLEFDSYDIPIGILSLGTILKRSGFDVEIFDYNFLLKKGELEKGENKISEMDRIGEYLLKLNPRVISFYTMCNSYHISIIIAKYIKDKKKDIQIIFGGPQATLVAEATLKAFPWIDVIGIGEGETIIEKLISSLEKNRELINVPSIAYRDSNGKVRVNKSETLIDELDNLPMINYNLIDMQYYDITSIEAGRGCPFGCIYCSSKEFWKRKFRLKSIERIVEEIKNLKKNYNRSIFTLEHDLFTFNKEKVIEFCDLIINENLNITWRCSSRADTIDAEMISIMSKSGCKEIFLGIESGSQRMQKIINKNLNLEKVWPCISELINAGIKPTLSFIYGFPEETLEDVRCTLEMIRIARSINIKDIQLHLCVALPGTELYNNVSDILRLNDNQSDITGLADITGFVNLISNHPDIFPQFYDINTDLRFSLKYLGIFIKDFYFALYNNFNITLKVILKYFKDDLLELFLNFISQHDLVVDLNNVSLRDKNLEDKDLLSRIKLLSDFISKGYFSNYTDIITEAFQFEKDIFRFDTENNNEERKTYNIDVSRLITECPENLNILCRSVTLKFVKCGIHKVKISKLK